MLILSETNGTKINVYFPMEDKPHHKLFKNKRKKETSLLVSYKLFARLKEMVSKKYYSL